MSEPRDLTTIAFGPLSNLGLMTRPDFALFDDIATRWQTSDPAVRYTNVTGLTYSARFGGLILQPNTTLRNLPSAQVSCLLGAWRDCTPPELGVTCPLAYDASANATPLDSQGMPVLTTQLRGGLLAANPHLILSLVRTEAPPEGQPAESQRWQLRLGDYTLTWGRFAAPVLACRGVEIARLLIETRDREAFAFATHQRWEIDCLRGQLHLACTGFHGDWVVATGDLPAAAWEFAANGGKYAVNVTPVTFATSGSLITPWTEEYVAYPNSDVVIGLFPADSSGQVSVTPYAVNGTRKRYRVTLTGSGAGTPLLQAYEVRYEPQFAARTSTWTDATPWLVTGSEQLGEELAARSSEFVFRRDAAFQAAIGSLVGHHAVRYTAGYDDGAGHTMQQQRMTGLLRRSRDDGLHLTATLYDRWTQLADVKLLFPPCLLGLTRGTALMLLATRGGIPPDLIVVHDDVVGMVGDPVREIAELPAWMPRRGVSVADALRRVLDTFGIRGEFRPDGTLHFFTTESSAPVAAFSSDEGAEAQYALGTDAFCGVTVESDLTGVVNTLVAVGLSTAGTPLLVMQSDADSITNPASARYLGYPATAYRETPDLTTLPQVTEFVARTMKALPGGLPQVTLTSRQGYALCHLFPRRYIQVTDPLLGDARVCRVLRMVVEYRPDRPPRTTVTLEVLPCV